MELFTCTLKTVQEILSDGYLNTYTTYLFIKYFTYFSKDYIHLYLNIL